MPAAKLNLAIEQGATWRHGLQVRQGVGAQAPGMNLTGYTARMQLRNELPAPAVLLELTNTNGRIVITPLTGELMLVLTATETAALSFDGAVYDLEIVSSGGEVTRLLQGKVSLSLEVTR